MLSWLSSALNKTHLLILCQRTPWGGWKKEGVENLTNDAHPKRGFGTPLVRYVFHPPQVSVLCFSCTKIRDRADQKLFWRGPKIFGRVRSLVRFSSPHTFCTLPPISRPGFRKIFQMATHVGLDAKCGLDSLYGGNSAAK